jgi:methionyl-tRNA formyltransferase
MRYVFAGDRAISCDILQFLIDKKSKPLALFVSEKDDAHNEKIDRNLWRKKIYFVGNNFRSKSLELLKNLDLDYIIGIHFPYIIPSNVLNSQSSLINIPHLIIKAEYSILGNFR